jgi:hypothetical protein
MNGEDTEDFFDNLMANSIDEFLRIVVDSEVPAVLAHYTTTDALLNILEKGELWFSHARFLSDTTELEYGMNLMAEAFDIRDKELQDCGFIEGMKYHGLYPLKKYLSDLFDSSLSPYVFCLCENANQLSQWREYSATEGYSICFSVRGLSSLKPELGAKKKIRLNSTLLCKVVYEKDRQMEVANRILSVIVQRCNQLKKRGVIAEDKHTMDFLSIAGRAIIDCVIKFKDNCFHEEREWRAYRWVAKEDESLLKYRKKGDSIMPYLVVKNPTHGALLPITLIYFSSSFDQQIRDKGLRMFCHSKGYEVNVIPNGFPPLR